MTAAVTRVRVGPGDISVDPAYWATDDSDLMAHLEAEPLRKFEHSLTEVHGDFEDLLSHAEPYSEIVYWLGQALFRLIKANPQVGRNRYVPVRQHLLEVEFEVAQALELMLALLWEPVKKEAQEEYNRLLAADIPF